MDRNRIGRISLAGTVFLTLMSQGCTNFGRNAPADRYIMPLVDSPAPAAAYSPAPIDSSSPAPIDSSSASPARSSLVAKTPATPTLRETGPNVGAKRTSGGVAASKSTAASAFQAPRSTLSAPGASNLRRISAQGPEGGVTSADGKLEGSAATMALSDLLRLTVEKNPRLAQASLAIESAQGRMVQAGLYPNPTLELRGDELGDRTGPAGILTLPGVTQEIVTGNKLGLARAAAQREVDQATLGLIAERYSRFTAVRQSYYNVLSLQQRTKILDQLVKVAEQSADATKRLMAAKQAAKLDLLQLEIEVERFRAEKEAVLRELRPAMTKLAANVGVASLPQVELAGSLEATPPGYELEAARSQVLGNHPEVLAALIGVDRANLLLKRAQAEPIPNVTVGANFIRQTQNRSNDFGLNISFPIPTWNKNEGAIQSAHAGVGEAIQQVTRVENELSERLATAFASYAAARQRADRYRTEILPRAVETQHLSLRAFQGGQFEYLRVLQAQRALAEGNLEYVKALGEVWHAASEIAGLLLEEEWPRPSPETSRRDTTP